MRCNPTSMRPAGRAAAIGCLLAAVGLLVVASGGRAEGVPTDAAPADMPVGLRVRIKLDVHGELLAPVGPDAPAVREPVEMTARFDFEETFPAASTAETTLPPAATVRRSYRDATAAMRFGDATMTATLAADARQLLVARQGTTPMPYLAHGFLSGEESDLLETPFDSLLLDDLLPREPVSIGQTWEIPADLTAGLLAIDTVESGSIEARVHEVSDGRAKVTFAGIIDGAVDGVPTHVTVEGSFAVAATEGAANDSSTDSESPLHRLHGRVSQVSADIRERRQASHVAPGFEVEARLVVARTALDSATEMAAKQAVDAVVGEDAEDASAAPAQGRPSRRRGEGGPGRVWYRDTKGRFDLVHDARWRRVEDGEKGLVMRLVDRGALVGQCSITSLPQAAAASLPTREDVQRDIERSLAGQVVRSDATDESDRVDGLRVVRVASAGTAGRLPFRWIHYVLAAQDGSRVSVTFMFEESLVQRFGDADRPLIDGLRLTASTPSRENTPNQENTPSQENMPNQENKIPAGPTAAAPGDGRQQTR
jgi:hypothetical protein